MSTLDKKTKSLPRRAFLKASSYGVLAAATTLSALAALTSENKKLLLRPPGALDEKTFLASCIKCGQCLQVCPPQIIELTDLRRGFGLGTPFINPREGACILCKGLPCVLSCPTGALDHHISEGKEAEMGLAELSSPETCLSIRGESDLLFRINRIEVLKGLEKEKQVYFLLETYIHKIDETSFENLIQYFSFSINNSIDKLENNLTKIKSKDIHSIVSLLIKKPQVWQWLKDKILSSPQSKTSCDLCLSECPIKAEAPIVFTKNSNDKGPRPMVQKSCVGCGVCEMICPTDQASISILPRKKWKDI